jgi:hypothetical protein
MEPAIKGFTMDKLVKLHVLKVLPQVMPPVPLVLGTLVLFSLENSFPQPKIVL